MDAIDLYLLLTAIPDEAARVCGLCGERLEEGEIQLCSVCEPGHPGD